MPDCNEIDIASQGQMDTRRLDIVRLDQGSDIVINACFENLQECCFHVVHTVYEPWLTSNHCHKVRLGLGALVNQPV